MKLSTFDISRIKALYHLLAEAHVGRAAGHLGITPAAASNALRRLREDFGDPLLVRNGRGLVRTRIGNELLAPARHVMEASEQLLHAARPFEPAGFSGQLPIAMAEHVAAVLLPEIDRLARARTPHAQLMISAIPEAVSDWVERTGGVLVGPVGAFAAAVEGDKLSIEPLYEDHYVVALRSGHAFAARDLDVDSYAALDHVLVTPRGRTQRSDIDEQLAERGLERRIARVLPSFTLALPLVAQSDFITTVPRLYARRMSHQGMVVRNLPLATPPLAMGMIVHPAHRADAAVLFTKQLLKDALAAAEFSPPASDADVSI